LYPSSLSISTHFILALPNLKGYTNPSSSNVKSAGFSSPTVEPPPSAGREKMALSIFRKLLIDIIFLAGYLPARHITSFF
jgi:hypothetical protein